MVYSNTTARNTRVAFKSPRLCHALCTFISPFAQKNGSQLPDHVYPLRSAPTPDLHTTALLARPSPSNQRASIPGSAARSMSSILIEEAGAIKNRH